MPDLHKFANDVKDEKSFIEFIGILAQDREDEVKKEKEKPSSPYGPGANGWENVTIENFLEASAAWAASSMNGLPTYTKPDNPWTRCAQILLMGKVYE